MKFIPMSDLLTQASRGGYAVPSFCVWNAETIETVLRTASELRAVVILMNGPGEFSQLGPHEVGAVANVVAERFAVPAALHLDHGNSLSQVEECLAAGYTSVMLDYSTRPFAENVEAMSRVVEMAHPLGVSVEGELGVVGRVDQISAEGGEESALTDPAMAAAFVEQTGIDALAVSIGNAHGHYPQLPRLDFERLAALREAVRIPLVLHGGTGTPEADLRHAISLGIAKVNVASELVTAIRQSLMEQWGSGENLWIPAAQTVAMQALAKVMAKWFHMTGSAGRA
ncbi:MAG TPA: class II fructose-bisphosphate aldolase [Hyphomicrobiaceae bacterium]|nr:class II fructose-bisphosphate aldolase [Hyphomicrobiaceae bacterium]